MKEKKQANTEKLSIIPEYLIETYERFKGEILQGMTLKQVAQKKDYLEKRRKKISKWISGYFFGIAGCMLVISFLVAGMGLKDASSSLAGLMMFILLSMLMVGVAMSYIVD